MGYMGRGKGREQGRDAGREKDRQRAAEIFLREAAEILAEEVADPELEAVTLTGARPSHDGRTVTLLYTLHTRTGAAEHDADQADAIQTALTHASGFFRSRLAERIDPRRMPEIAFAPDTGFDTAFDTSYEKIT